MTSSFLRQPQGRYHSNKIACLLESVEYNVVTSSKNIDFDGNFDDCFRFVSDYFGKFGNKSLSFYQNVDFQRPFD